MTENTTPKNWWLVPLLIGALFIGGIAYAWQTSEAAKEILAKSFFTIAGTLASPFILESSIAIFGLVAVLTYNQWRREKDGPEWVEMEVPDSPKIDSAKTTASETNHAA